MRSLSVRPPWYARRWSAATPDRRAVCSMLERDDARMPRRSSIVRSRLRERNGQRKCETEDEYFILAFRRRDQVVFERGWSGVRWAVLNSGGRGNDVKGGIRRGDLHTVRHSSGPTKFRCPVLFQLRQNA